MMRSSIRVVIAAAAASASLLAMAVGPSAATAPPDTTPATTESPASTAPVAPSTPTGSATTDGEWEQVIPGEDCQCSDGSEWSYFVREADPAKVLFVLEGGGACWSNETCAPGGPYDPDVSEDDHPDGIGGVVDLDEEANPFRDHSIVYVPYCTGDVHIGNVEQDYDDSTIQHKGAANASTALQAMTERFPDADQVVVAGASAGSIATPLYAGMAQDRYPDAHVVALGDGSGGYPADGGAVNAELMATWGFGPRVAAWPEAAAIDRADWNFTRFWSVAAEHAPELELVRFDFAADAVQLAFIGYAGLPAVDLLAAQEENEATIEADGWDVQSYVAGGDGHTVILSDAFYETTVDGVALTDWLAEAIAEDEPVDDVRCPECEAAAGGANEPSSPTTVAPADDTAATVPSSTG